MNFSVKETVFVKSMINQIEIISIFIEIVDDFVLESLFHVFKHKSEIFLRAVKAQSKNICLNQNGNNPFYQSIL